MIGGILFAMLSAVPQDTNVARLPTVEVTVAREPARSALELPFALTRIAPDSVRPGMRNASIDERLFLLPGVLVANRNNPTQDPRLSIRGFGSRSAFGVRGVRIQMDGVPLTLPDGQTALDYLDLESIGSLEVIRGSAASLYGNAAGGVIDIRSRPVPKNAFAPTAAVWMGSNRQHKLAASFGGTTGETEYALSISRMEIDSAREHSRQYSQQEVTNGSLRLATQLGNFRVSAGFLVNDMPLAQNPGALTLAEMLANPDSAQQLSVRRAARKEVSQVLAGLTISTASADGKGELELVIHGGARDLNNPLTFAIVAVERASHGASLRGSRSLSFLSKPSRLTFGFDYQKQNDDRTQYANCNEIPALTAPTANCPTVGEERGVLQRDQKELITGIGPYIRGEMELSNSFRLSTGVRYDRINFEARDALIGGTNPDDSGERTLTAVSPMVGLVFRASRMLSVYANYSTAFETPTATEFGNQPDGSAGFNPELDPQRAVTFEVGSRGWLRTPWPAGLSFDLAVYNTAVEDELISFEDQLVAGRTFFRNAGSTGRMGLEASLATALGPATFALSYGYSQFEFNDYAVTTGGTTNVYDGNRIPGIPVQQLQGAVTLRKNVWYLTLEGETRGSIFVDDANTTRSAGYEAMNVRLGGEGIVGLRWLSPRFGVQNVFDRKYAASVAVNAVGGRYYEPAAGRTIYGGITISGVR